MLGPELRPMSRSPAVSIFSSGPSPPSCSASTSIPTESQIFAAWPTSIVSKAKVSPAFATRTLSSAAACPPIATLNAAAAIATRIVNPVIQSPCRL
jgi:hypothetical protein